MTEQEFEACRKRFQRFARRMLRSLEYPARQQWAQVYLQGLLLVGRRKSCGAIARRLGEEGADPREQSLQQFLSQSRWEPTPVRKAIAKTMVRALGRGGAWLCDDSGLPKKGSHSVGVARQYFGKTGRTENCQVAVSLSYANAQGAMPLDWELYLPKAWTEDPARRSEVGIPKEVTFQSKWRLALGMIDRCLRWGLPRPEVIVGDADYGRPTGFREALEARRLHYVFAVEGKLVAWREPRGPRPESLKTIAASLPASAWEIVSWREGSQGELSSRFARVRMQRAPEWEKGREPGPEGWLLVEWPLGKVAPETYWLSDLSASTSLRTLVSWAKSRYAIEQNYQEMKSHLGLEHFEGRSWPGWHHHVTMVLLAFAFVLSERLREASKGGALFPAFPKSWDGSRDSSVAMRTDASGATSPMAADPEMGWIPGRARRP